ncbi:MAG: lipid A biosynthesis lauroyl acyltransferase [Betaproteobacteria bacterium]|nr:lipid A biosynthesis lauroyl acyltransferase [Betaproteobacteria bacterium]
MRLVLLLLWCLRWLPRTWVRAMGRALGSALFHIGRRRVTLINLRACLPEKTEAERIAIGREVFRNLSASALELGHLWYAPVDEAIAVVEPVDFHFIDAWHGKAPVIVLAPHFAGLEFAGARFSHHYPTGFSMYSVQKNTVFDRALRRARQRWNGAELVTRQQGLRPVLKALKAGRPFYYLPDMDFGARDTVFADFFGIPTATVTALSRICRITGAKVVPMIARMTATGYEARCYPAWDNFPSGDDVADARRMNAFLEERIREMPGQYFWVHKRFKTRPPGEPGFYD